jgi:hypothetical protein
MVAVPISRSEAQARYPQSFPPPAGSASLPAPAPSTASPDWTHYVAAGTLLAGGVLMVTGHKRAGMAVAAAGTAMALFEEQEAIKSWWNNLPGYLNDAQDFLDKIEGYLEEAAIQGERLQSMLRR